MKLLDYMKDNIVYLDGGMGTLIQEAGLPAGEYPENWNITHPEVIEEIHRSYFDAGSNIVNTNTFGANSLKFSNEKLKEIIKSAIENASRARKSSKGSQEKYIALDIGPCGKLLKPYGDLAFEDAVELFAEIVRAGDSTEVDLIFIETMSDSYETKAALLAAKENSNLPVFVSNAYGEDGKLMTGANPAAMVALIEGMGADAVGANCSLEPKQLRGVVDELLKNASIPVLLKPNAGLPKEVDGKAIYETSSDEFASDLKDAVSKGVRLIGGCCGTNPEYISKITSLTSAMKPLPIEPKNITCASSYTHAVKFDSSPILIGERINPTGKKRFKQALLDEDINYILQEGVNQQELGVHILDVNVGLPEIDEADMLKKAVFELQSVINLPLQIDTADTTAMEAALRLYNGKAMINSVSGKESSMDAIFPLVKKYGGLVVALTLDDNGIPKTAEGRIEIAKKIIDRASEYGIDKKDIIFDTLAMTISADSKAAAETLKALDFIKNELGCHTSLGVSNISFGLPKRDFINSTFFACALEKGLSAAIMNPYSSEMMKTYYAFNALHNNDENCSEYINFAETVKIYDASPAVPEQKSTESSSNADCSSLLTELQQAITKGLKEKAGELTENILSADNAPDPLSIIQEEIIPALDIVGKGFEKKTIYLPQLLMSAEAAKASFEHIKLHMSNEIAVNKSVVVIATVHGDIHDIGKNIVKLLLENYGFKVVDLGKDVAPETITAAVIEYHAPAVGLSALMTTTVPSMEKTIQLLKEKAPWCRVVVGGAVLNQEYSDKIGADKYAKDAMDTVRYVDVL
ncbi:MAG: homocysteine S-methyltransferase family protein [Firmicutes bacterium]|nr:homocysteine S-methyltransferase family protein [Bacillota bacterium]